MKGEVLEFIEKFKFHEPKIIEYLFMNGNCYYFAVILKDKFNGEIYYLPIANHFVCKIDNDFYDITGFCSINEKPYLWDTFEKIESTHKERIVRDCIDFKTRKIAKK